MIAPDVFRHVPVLLGDGVRLEPLTDAVFDDYLTATADPEVRRLTGSHAVHDDAAIRRWLATRADHHDRADWAVLGADDGRFLGEAVLNDLDPANASATFRILLAPHAIGRATAPGQPGWSSSTGSPSACTVSSWGSTRSTRERDGSTRSAGSSSRGGCAKCCGGTAPGTTNCGWPCSRRRVPGRGAGAATGRGRSAAGR